MADEAHQVQPPESGRRRVQLQRTTLGHYEVRNARGGRIPIGDGTAEQFTPVELLLAAIAGCASVDVDHMTTRRAEPEAFDVVAEGTKVATAAGNQMEDIEVTFRLRFPEGPDGDAARARIDAAIRASHERDCTVSRTVEQPTPVHMRADR